MTEEEKDIELQIDVMKAQLQWDWRLTWIVILVGILVALAGMSLPPDLYRAVLGLLLSIILLSWGLLSGWPDEKAEELREKYSQTGD